MSSKYDIPKTFLVTKEQAEWIDNQPKKFNFSEAMRKALDEIITDC